MLHDLLALTKLILDSTSIEKKTDQNWEKDECTEKFIISLVNEKISDECILELFKKYEEYQMDRLNRCRDFSQQKDSELIKNIIKKTRPDLTDKLEKARLSVWINNLFSVLTSLLVSEVVPDEIKADALIDVQKIVSDISPEDMPRLQEIIYQYGTSYDLNFLQLYFDSCGTKPNSN